MSTLKGVHHNERGGWYAIVDDETFEWQLKAGGYPAYRNDSGDFITGENSILKAEFGSFNLNTVLTDEQRAKFGDLLDPARQEMINKLWNGADSDQRLAYLDLAESGWNSIRNQETELGNIAGLGPEGDFGPRAGSQRSLPINNNFGVLQNQTRARAVGEEQSRNVLKYPIDMDLSIQDHMAITAAEYVPAGKLPGIRQGTDRGQFLRTRNEKLLETIIIPMPNSVADECRVQWGDDTMGGVAGRIFSPIAENFLNGSNDFLQDSYKTLAGAGTGLLEAAGSGYVQRRFLLNAARAAASAIGVNVTVAGVLGRTVGVIENPNLELLFSGPGLRVFNFTIRLTPRSSDESIMIRQIIRTFKQRMAVKRNVNAFKGTGANLLLGTPAVFRLQYRRGSTSNEEIKGLNKFKTCALTDFQVDYTGGSGRWSAYADDSQPMTTIMTMQFAELAPIYEDDYAAFTSGDDVGF